MSYTITLPIPPTSLSPNGRAHFQRKAADKKSQREAAFGYASAQVRGAGPKWERAGLTIRWFARNKARIPDLDNCIASLKGAIDGIEDAGIIKDDWGIERVDVWRVCDSLLPRVEITVEEIKPS